MVRLVTAALIVLVLVAGALTVRAQQRPQPERAEGRRVTIVLRDFRFDPQSLSVRSGRLTIVLRNEGRLGHGFRLRKNGRLWIKQPTLKPGETVRITRRLEQGDYRMFDALSNYEELGMYGTLSVR